MINSNLNTDKQNTSLFDPFLLRKINRIQVRSASRFTGCFTDSDADLDLFLGVGSKGDTGA